MDVICVQNPLTNELVCTNFFIKFTQTFADKALVGILGLNTLSTSHHPSVCLEREYLDALSQNNFHENLFSHRNFNCIEVIVNGISFNDVPTMLDNDCVLFFYDEERQLFSLNPNQSILNKFNLQDGKNNLVFKHKISQLSREFFIWKYDINRNFVVMDIDGTITKSNVKGYIQTVFLRKYSHIHDGVVDMLNHLVAKYDLSIIYLTSRPISHYKQTRSLISHTKDGITEENLPEGPLFINRDRIIPALYRELIAKNTVELKHSILQSVVEIFHDAGDDRSSPLLLGFGNQENDALAYQLAGIKSSNIFIINKSSHISVWKNDSADSNQDPFISYRDKNLFNYVDRLIEQSKTSNL